ncbi:MAG TPA: biotin/lipoyl-containing protein [Candidatus Acidoferrales bacterium]|nr:biotin/lipoyl-containing protein [Candidatus Acidoferrales bacterium]
MKLDIQLGGPPHTVEISRTEHKLQCTIDGIALGADCVEVAADTYSILLAGRSFEASVEAFGEELCITISGREFAARVRDPRKWQRNHSAAATSEHRQNVLAPMPGRIVRVLVVAGETIKAGQGIVVVEAMKMQNEVRAPRAGKVERLLVKEGQPVNAGETIAVVG